ncbi:uncharacterized protein LOC109724970 [Ananas comosus]|uniref:Uncharacterized protein LOC109724970 n=1 Tax=Ananas comosus TaxID=4615 RepID=A0A6P5GVK9_ANACO|nr:uncharacterized protein LOC109724970 [Ananas comosus]XP_020109587.1 uncharacterized protein LOC109724970 [Ananas comosus]
MRLDGEQPSNHNFADQIASKVIRPNEENLTIDMFKVEKEVVWNEKHGHLSSVEKILGEHTNTSQRTYLALRNSDNRIQSDIEQQPICTDTNGLVGKKDLSAEKTVTEIHLPDPHIVKDICVDELVRSVDKKLIDNEVEHKTSSGIYYSVGTVKEGQSEEMATAIAHDSKSRTVCEPLICVIDKDTEKQPFPESSYGVRDQMNMAEQIVGDRFHEPISSQQLIPPKDCIEEPQKVFQDSFISSNDHEQSVDARAIDQDLLECSTVQAVPSDTSKLQECSWMKENLVNGFSKDMIEDYSTIVGVISEMKESSGNVGCLDVISNSMLEEGFNAAVQSGTQTLSQIDYAKENPFDSLPSNLFNGCSKDMIADYSTVVGVTSETKESSQSSGNVGGLDGISNNVLEEGFTAAVHSGAQTLSQADYAKENPFDGFPSYPSNGFTKEDMTVDYSTVVGVISEMKESSQSSANVGGLDVISNNMLEEGFNAAVHSGAQTLSQADYAKENPFDGLPSNPSNGFSKDMIVDFSTVVGVISETKESSRSSGKVGSLGVISNNMLEEGFNAAVHYGAQTLSQADCAKENSSNGLPSNPFATNSADSKIIAGCEIDGLDTCDFNPRAGETICTNDGEKAIESWQPRPVPNDHFVEGAITDDGTNSARTFVYQNRGDFNSPGPMISSGPTASSGHIPYSGSISLRSDSSTTSTRSFAFPILQTEWNSSPVKMTKSKHRHSRKSRGWGWGLLCCKF